MSRVGIAVQPPEEAVSAGSSLHHFCKFSKRNHSGTNSWQGRRAGRGGGRREWLYQSPTQSTLEPIPDTAHREGARGQRERAIHQDPQPYLYLLLKAKRPDMGRKTDRTGGRNRQPMCSWGLEGPSASQTDRDGRAARHRTGAASQPGPRDLRAPPSPTQSVFLGS